MRKYTIILASALFITASCSNDKDLVNATIVDTGDITNEGCGYLLQLDDKELVQPNNLPSSFHHDGLKVKVKFTHTGVRDTCDYGTVIYDLATIQEIKKNLDR
jgi:hypothetical protein